MKKESLQQEKFTPEPDISEVPCAKKHKCKTLLIEGTKYRTTFTSKFENRKKYIPIEKGKIISCLPGTVVDIFVKTGEIVNQGQSLITLDAMKMMNKLTIPIDGEVKSIYVKKGDVISKGQLIAEIV